jgi:tryptophan synthase alpha chain
MTRIEDMFAALKQAGQRPRTVMVRLCAGLPNADALAPVLESVELGGAGAAEIVLPDPAMLGVTGVVARAVNTVVRAGTTLGRALDSIARARSNCSITLVGAIGATGVFAAGGPKAFARAAAQAGLDAIFLTDVPLEESSPFADAAASHGLACPLLVAPSTDPERADRIVKASTGFVRMQTASLSEAHARAAHLREMTDLPIACACGASDARSVFAVAEFCEIVDSGDVLLDRLETASARGQDVAAVTQDVASDLCRGLRGID